MSPKLIGFYGKKSALFGAVLQDTAGDVCDAHKSYWQSLV
jgi:hypothetical protein